MFCAGFSRSFILCRVARVGYDATTTTTATTPKRRKMPETAHHMNGYANGHAPPELQQDTTFLFTSESVGEGHPGETQAKPRALPYRGQPLSRGSQRVSDPALYIGQSFFDFFPSLSLSLSFSLSFSFSLNPAATTAYIMPP